MAAAQIRRQQAQRDLGLGPGLGRGLGLGVGKQTETFHRLPTIRQHPEKETIKKQSQTITQATATFAKLSIDNECIPHI